MKKIWNIVDNVLLILITLFLAFILANISNQRYYENNMFLMILYCLIGVIISAFICTFFHEMGHVLSGKKNRFFILSFTIWFFKWTKKKKGYRFDFVKFGEASGYTETVPMDTENLSKRLKCMTLSGTLAVILPTLICLIPLLVQNISFPLFCILSMFLPVGVYVIVGNILPMENVGFKNDGAMIVSLNRKDDVSKVVLSCLSIQSEMYNGKTPSQIDEKYYFSCPQLPEDSPYFIMLLNNKYNYYLDKEDYENAKKTMQRLLSLEDYISKSIMMEIKADALFESCTYNFNGDRADDLMYELDKYLNNNNSMQTIRVKLAYMFMIKGDKERFNDFYDMALKEIRRCKIKGLGEYNKKLLALIK